MTDGHDARDMGIGTVMEGEDRFAVRVMAIVKSLPRGWRGIGEDIRLLADQHGIPRPHHHNCWGGVMFGCVKAGLLTPTGDWRHMRIKRSHARKSPEYVR